MKHKAFSLTFLRSRFRRMGAYLQVVDGMNFCYKILKRNRRLALFRQGHSPIQALAFSPGGRALASGSIDNKVQLWDTATTFHLATLTGHTEVINALAFSPDGTTLASWSADGTILLWDWNKIRSNQ